MRNQERRVGDLEARAGGPGVIKVVLLDYHNRPAEVIERELAAAEAATQGPNDQLIKIVYTDDWRPAGLDDELGQID